MSFTFVKSNNAGNDASGTTLAVQLTTVTAGNLIVIWASSADTSTFSVDDALGTVWVSGTYKDDGVVAQGQFFWTFSQNTGGTVNYTVTWGTAKTFRRVCVMEFSFIGTPTLDTQNTGAGTTNPATSGSISTNGAASAWLVLGGTWDGNISGVSSNEQINGVVADGVTRAAGTGSMWYLIPVASFSGGTAIATIPSVARWVCNIVAFQTVGVIPSTGAYQQEQNTTDRYQLEDGSGVYLIEPWGTAVTQFPPRWWGDLDGIGKSFPRDRLN